MPDTTTDHTQVLATPPRTWHMFADLADRHDGGTFWRDVYDDPRSVLMSGGVPTPVVLTEDPAGEYRGWLAVRDGVLDESRVAMVQHAKLFSIQFPYGVKAEIDRGNGNVVHVRIEATKEAR